MTAVDDSAGASVYERGMSMRRKVLGDAHVDRSMGQVSEFARAVQDLVTEYCWGAVWSRGGLDLRTRARVRRRPGCTAGQPHRDGGR